MKPNTKHFDLILCILEFVFCILERQPFLNRTFVEKNFKLSTISYRDILGCLDIERVVQLEEVFVIT